jgi:hypothetical protein
MDSFAGAVFKRIFSRRHATADAGTGRSWLSTGPQTCPACGSNFVHPVSWHAADDRSWWMLLHCGACHLWGEETFPDAVAERFDRALDRAQAEIARAAERLSRERLTEQADAFAIALARDLIDADDFAA